MIETPHLAKLDLEQGVIEGAALTRRHLSELRNSFADQHACRQILATSDPLLYTVSAVEPAHGDGQLHYALGMLMPGKVGSEYFMTKGHYHASRQAAEVYVGLRGEGLMLLQDEQTGESRLVPLCAQGIVYVPGHTAHRTINSGREPLLYLGIYPANAGHDYAALAQQNFNKVVIDDQGSAKMLDRAQSFDSGRL